jgi:alkylhydroperoxidase/carboxymuconolactone decarboxylase family protein YurZ
VKSQIKEEISMEEKTNILICIGAATAANCIPCFEHFYGKAQEAGLTDEEIQEAVDLASQVKKGAHMALRNSISKVMNREKKYSMPCDRSTDRSCCG